MNESFDVNRANWNERADLHAASPGYQVEQFVSQPEHLSEVVRFDLPRLEKADSLNRSLLDGLQSLLAGQAGKGVDAS